MLLRRVIWSSAASKLTTMVEQVLCGPAAVLSVRIRQLVMPVMPGQPLVTKPFISPKT